MNIVLFLRENRGERTELPKISLYSKISSKVVYETEIEVRFD